MTSRFLTLRGKFREFMHRCLKFDTIENSCNRDELYTIKWQDTIVVIPDHSDHMCTSCL